MARATREASLAASDSSSVDPLDCIDNHDSHPPSPKPRLTGLPRGSRSPVKRKPSVVQEKDDRSTSVRTTKQRREDSEASADLEISVRPTEARPASSSKKAARRVLDSDDESPSPITSKVIDLPYGSSDIPFGSPSSDHPPLPPTQDNVSQLADTHVPPVPINSEPATTLPPISAAGHLPSDRDLDVRQDSSHHPAAPFNLVPPGQSPPTRSSTPNSAAQDDHTWIAEGDESKDQQDNSLISDIVMGAPPTPPATSGAQAANVDQISTFVADEEQVLHSTAIGQSEAEAYSIAQDQRTAPTPQEETGTDHPKAEAIPGVTIASDLEQPISTVVDTAPLPPLNTSEGEEELEEETGNDAMDIDQPVPTPSAVTEIPPSTPASTSRASSPIKQKGKPGPKPKPKDKDAKAKPSSSTAAAAKKGAKAKAKTKVDDLKSVSAKARSESVSSVQPSVSIASSEAPGGKEHLEDEIDDADNAIYCVCKKPYNEEDGEVVMVACDGCDNWFHPECIGMTEAKLDLLDSYICAECEKTSAQRTSYKSICKRERCDVSVAGRSSKYCSSTCAFQHMAEQIPPNASKKLLQQLASTFIGLPRPKQGITTVHHDIPGTVTNSPKPDIIPAIQAQVDAVNAAIVLVQKRQSLLQQVIARCDALAPIANQNHSTTSKKGKSARSAGEDKACGWDERLLWDEGGVSSWDGSGAAKTEDGGAEGVCMTSKRRCDRHQGWQKSVAASLEVELGELANRRGLLEAQKTQQLDLREADETALKASEAFRRHLAARPAVTA